VKTALKRIRKDPKTGPYMFEFFSSTVTESTVSSRVCLPDVICSVCGEGQSHGDLALPHLKVPADLPPRRFTRLTLSGKNRMISVSKEEFDSLVARLRQQNRDLDQAMPGEWVGPRVLKTKGKLTDVICNSVELFYSGGLIAAAQKAGVVLHPEPISVVHRGKAIQDYYYCRPTLVELWDPRTLVKFYDRCSGCGGVRQKKSIWAVQADHGRAYRKAKWPGREGIVYSYEHMDLLFSDEFVRVATQGQFVGLSFKRAGRWC
jgi:hypothetical protein